MRSEVVRRAHVAKPRRDAIAVTIPRQLLWIGAGAVACFGLLSCAIGFAIGRGTREEPAPVAARASVSDVVPKAPPAAPPPETIDEAPEAAEESEAIDEPPPPPPPPKQKAKLDIRERLPRGKHGLQVGAFPDRNEARKFLETHAAELAKYPIYMLPAKVGSKGTWVRVRVGSFDNAAEAERARKALPDDLAKSSMVVRFN